MKKLGILLVLLFLISGCGIKPVSYEYKLAPAPEFRMHEKGHISVLADGDVFLIEDASDSCATKYTLMSDMDAFIILKASNYADLATAISTIGSTNATLIIDSAESLSANATFPSTLSVEINKPGYITIASAKKLTIDGAFNAYLGDIFRGSGEVVFDKSPIVSVFPEWWGDNTTPGTTDMTSALNDAWTCAEASGVSVQLASSTYLVSGTLTTYRGVSTYGAGPANTKITAASEQTLRIHGTNPTTSRMDVVQGIEFYKVGILYGDTNATGSRGCKLDSCEISYVTKGVEYRYLSWNTWITDCLIHHCTYGVYFDYANATSAGASQVFSGSIASDNDYGIYVTGKTIDGYDIQITNCDLEHSAYYGVYIVNAGSGCVFTLANIHFEENLYGNIYNDGAIVQVSGGWIWTPTNTGNWVAHFKCVDGRIRVGNVRISWTNALKIVEITGTGEVHLQLDTITMSSIYDTNPYSASTNTTDASCNGLMVPLGYVRKLTLADAVTSVPASDTEIFRIHAWDKRAYRFSFVLDVTAVAGANKLLIKVEATDAGQIELVMPNSVGSCFVQGSVDYKNMVVEWTYDEGTGGYARRDVDANQALSENKFIYLENSGNSTMGYNDLIVSVLE